MAGEGVRGQWTGHRVVVLESVERGACACPECWGVVVVVVFALLEGVVMALGSGSRARLCEV
jgi:hypothetical protein